MQFSLAPISSSTGRTKASRRKTSTAWTWAEGCRLRCHFCTFLVSLSVLQFMIPCDSRTRSHVLLVQLLDKVANRFGCPTVSSQSCSRRSTAPPNSLSLLAKDGRSLQPIACVISLPISLHPWPDSHSKPIISGVWDISSRIPPIEADGSPRFVPGHLGAQHRSLVCHVRDALMHWQFIIYLVSLYSS